MAIKKNKQIKIFISHTSADAAIARAFVESLSQALNVQQEQYFYFSSDDDKSITHGENIVTSVVQNLRDDSACVIALLTKQSHQKPWLQFEAGGAYVKSRLISILLPGCPPSEQLNKFFTWGKYINLRTLDSQKLIEIYTAVAEYFPVDEKTKTIHGDEFVKLFLAKTVNLFAEQVSAVCIRKLNTDKEPKILLVKNKVTMKNGKETVGTRRHFPKNKIKFGDHVVQPDTVAVLSAFMEAGVTVSPNKELITFKHYKSETTKEIDVTAFLVNYHEESEISTSSKLMRMPAWFTEAQAIKETSNDRKPKYAAEYKKVIKLAFAEWIKRNTK